MALKFLNNGYFAGTVGIGTESPLKKLSINGGDVAVNNGNSFIVGAAITGNSQIGELGADSGQLQLLTESTRDIKFGSTTYGNIMFLEGTNGNVGIGTNSPAKQLVVRGSAPWIRIEEDSASNKRLDLWVDPTSAIGYIGANQSAQQLSFQTASSDRIRILNNGNVGIGTTSPTQSKLVVDGTISIPRSEGFQYLESISGAFRAGIFSTGTNATGVGFNSLRFFVNADNTDPAMVIGGSTNNKNVGIGTDSPTQDLTLYRSSGDTNFLISSNNGASQIFFGDTESDNIGRIDYDHSNNSLNFAVNVAERMRIDSSGNVGIGTTSPGLKLDINSGTANSALRVLSTDRYTGIKFEDDTNNDTLFYDGQSDLMYLGSTNFRAVDLHAAGNLRVEGAIYDSNNSPGTSGQILSSTVTGADWIDGSAIPGVPAGSGTLNTVAMWTPDGDTLGNAPITISGNNSTFAGEITATNIYAETYRSSRTDGEIYIQAATASDFVSIGTQVANNLMRIEGGGNVGIGTTSPTKLLEVKSSSAYDSTVRLSTTAHNWDIQGGETGHSSTAFALDYDGTTFFRAMGVTDARFSGGLSVGTINTTPPTGGLYVVGNVGIGITGPLTKLHVFEAGTAMIRVDSGATAPYKAGIEFLRSSVNGGRIYNDGNAVQVKLESDFAYDAANPSRGGFQFKTAPTTSGTLVDAVRIDARGYVGIGTTSPTEKLTVAGTIMVPSGGGAWGTSSGGVQLNYNSGTSQGHLTTYYDSTSLVLGAGVSQKTGITINGQTNTSGNNIFFRVGNSERMRIDSSGNVGIGTTSPGTKLHIVLPGGSAQLTLERTGGSAGKVVLAGAAEGLIVYDDVYGAKMYVGTAGTYNGNVGISTITPSQKLHVAGNARVTGAYYDSNNSPGTANQVLVSTVTGTDWVDGSGSSIIGGPYLPLAGSVYDGNTGTWSNGVTGDLALVSTSGTKGIIIGDEDNGSGQLSAQFNSSNGNGNLTNNGGSLTITAQNYGDGSDIIFKGNDTSNNLITYFQTVGASQKVRVLDNIKFTIGTSDDLQISHDGFDSYINNFTGNLNIVNLANDKDIIFQSDNGSGGVTTYLTLDGSNERLQVDAPNGMLFPDNIIAKFGTSADLLIYHDGNNSRIVDNGTGELRLQGTNLRLWASNGENYLTAVEGGAVSLYYDAVKKFETTSTGVTVTGQLTVTNGIEMAAGNFNAGDGERIRLGNSADFQIYHDGSNSYINDIDTGDLYIQASDNMYFQTYGSGKRWITLTENAGVDLFYNDVRKLSTGIVGVGTATTAGGTLIDGWITTTQANAVNNTTIATTAYVNNKIALIPAGLVFQGTWNAATNTPTLTSGSGTTGNFYIVSTPGSTNLDGITDWKVGDWAVFIEQGASDQWEKIDNSSVLDGIGTGGSVAGWAGSGTSNTLTNAPITFSGNNTTFAGDVNINSVFDFNTSTDLLTITNNQNTGGINLSGGNSRIYFGGNRAIEGAQDGTNLTFAEGYTTAYIQSNTVVQGNLEISSTIPKLSFTDLQQDDWDIINDNGEFKLLCSTGTGVALQLNTDNSATFAGNVGIGTTSPQDRLHVKNSDAAGSNSRCDIRLENGFGYAEFGTLSNYARIQANGSEVAAMSRAASYFYTDLASFGAHLTTETTDGIVSINGGSGTGGEAYLRLMRGGTSGFLLNHTATAIQVRATANIPMFFYTNDTISLKINANNTISLPTYGAGYLKTDGSGNVTADATVPGTGTFLPLAGGTMTGNIDFVNNKDISMTDNAGAVTRVMVLNTSNTMYIGPVDTYAGGSILYGVAAGVSYQRFYTGASERMRIMPSGNVGIGTTIPDSLLHVSADVTGANTGTITIEGRPTGFLGDNIATIDFHNNGSKRADIRMERGNTANDSQLVFSTSDVGTLNDALIINEVGNVGIGVTPRTISNYKVLDISGSGGAGGYIGLSSGSTQQGELYSHGGGVDLVAIGAKQTRFFTNGSQQAVITSAGNVGIGTTSPGYKLQVGDNGVADGNIAMKANGTGADAGAELTFNMNVGGGNADSYIAQIVPIAYDSLSSGTHASLNFKVGAWNNNADAGVSRMTILSNGQVGIGTTNPLRKLDLIADLSTDAVRIKNTNSNGGGLSVFAANGGGGTNRILTLGDSSENIKVAVIENGNVGIGTTSPGRKLQVEGGDFYTNDKSDTAGASVGYGGNSFQIRNGSTSEDLNFDIFNRTTSVWGTPLIIKNTGNVGIGTTAPNAPLSVHTTQSTLGERIASFFHTDGTNNPSLDIKSISTGMQIKTSFSTGITGQLDLYTGGGSSFITLSTAGSEKVRITSAGNVGIGTTSPGSKLQVAGEIRVADGTKAAPSYSFTSDTNTGMYSDAADAIKFTVGGTDTLAMNSSNNVGIGTNAPDVKFHVTENEDGSGIDKGTAKFINTNTGQGATTMHMVQTSSSNFANAVKFWQGSTPTAVGFIRLTTSATQFITSASDLNLKKNITNWSDDTLSKFKALEPKKFRFKTQDVSEDKTLGFIAQNEVDNFPEAYPQFLGEDEKPYYGFNPTGMVPHLMKAIKDLVEKVETLENKITQLENNN